MKKILITYYSLTENTKKMAEIIEKAIDKTKFEVMFKTVEKTTKKDMLAADAIIVGTPTYYGLPSKEIVELLTERVRPHGLLEGKIGAAFSSSNNVGGGNETAILAVLDAMLVHGMIIQGLTRGDHYGPVSIGEPDARATGFCQNLAQKVCDLLERLS